MNGRCWNHEILELDVTLARKQWASLKESILPINTNMQNVSVIFICTKPNFHYEDKCIFPRVKSYGVPGWRLFKINLDKSQSRILFNPDKSAMIQ